jgi:hypothetical protein
MAKLTSAQVSYPSCLCCRKSAAHSATLCKRTTRAIELRAYGMTLEQIGREIGIFKTARPPNSFAMEIQDHA